jgi:hypothetical protein
VEFLYPIVVMLGGVVYDLYQLFDLRKTCLIW